MTEQRPLSHHSSWDWYRKDPSLERLQRRSRHQARRLRRYDRLWELRSPVYLAQLRAFLRVVVQ